MRQYFLYAIAALIPLAIGGWFLWSLGRALFSLFEDWRMGKELDELQAQSESRREQERLNNEKRWDNGCEHSFEHHVFGLPRGACSKCGIEKQKPAGACDHVWRLEKGPVPTSTCEVCGKTYNPSQEHGTIA